MHIKLLVGVQGEQGEHLAPDAVHDVSDWFGREIVATGRAVRVPGPDGAAPIATPAEPLTTRSLAGEPRGRVRSKA